MAEHEIIGAQHFPVSRFFNGIHMKSLRKPAGAGQKPWKLTAGFVFL